ncbi:MAG: thioredoxin domain-containing protein [Gemmataceae bacterium]
MSAPRFTNRLIHETSPYLRQHGHNPVDWYPWGEEAIGRARAENKPIFLSVGYSACQWCHVMEHESFEDEAIARILNDNFISIKVDREERPDLDQIYMASVQMMSGQGGWPMSVFLTPDLRPFTGGTYFPPDDRYGRPGFRRILWMLADAWQLRRDDIDRAAMEITQHLQKLGEISGSEDALSPDLIRQAGRYLERAFDPTHGGFGQAPKFLHTMDLRLLLRIAKRWTDSNALHMVRHTLEKMALGGIHDHLGGGFARYSTDSQWFVPHFEKMLYDNALLVTTYCEAYQVEKRDLYKNTVESTLEWVHREMTASEGPFFSALDADSEGEEGKFYVWTREEIEKVLGTDEADFFCGVFGVSKHGNWEDPHAPGVPKNILHRKKTDEQIARSPGTTVADIHDKIKKSREKLREAREQRVRPGLDDKVLTSWNGLMITALATASQVFDRPDYADRARRAARFILENMVGKDGQLFRTWSRGGTAKLNGYLEDYAFFLEGLLTLHEATSEVDWLKAAIRIADKMVDQFSDDKQGGFFYTARNHEALIARTRDLHDNATPSASSVAVTALLRLSEWTGRADYHEIARKSLQLSAGLMDEKPFAMAQMLMALDFVLDPPTTLALIGSPDGEDMRLALRALRDSFQPHLLVARGAPGVSEASEIAPLRGKKGTPGMLTSYLCQNGSCQPPQTGLQPILDLLKSSPS